MIRLLHNGFRRLGTLAAGAAGSVIGAGFVRLSRSAVLPPPFPDVFGLALRIQHPEGIADVLFSNTGTGRSSRFLLVPRRSLFSAYTTLIPSRTPSGPLTLRADILDPVNDFTGGRGGSRRSRGSRMLPRLAHVRTAAATAGAAMGSPAQVTDQAATG